MVLKKAVFLDRDGVINHLIERKDGSITSPWSVDEFRFLPNVKDAVDNIKKMGFMVLVVTNQPAIEEGFMRKEQLDHINEILLRWLFVDNVYSAFYKDTPNYKPNNGMIEHFIQTYNIDRNSSYIIGDRWKDIVPGHRSNLKTIFVGTEYIYPYEYRNIQPDFICKDLLHASEKIKEIENGI